MKCDRCGLQSDVEQAFSTEKHFLSGPRHFCPDCTIKRQTGSFISMLVIFCVFGMFFFTVNPASTLTAAML